MKKLLLSAALATLLSPAALLAADATTTAAPAARWIYASPLPGILMMVLFSLVGIALAIVGYKLFDRFTPGDLHREIVEERNVAAAIVGGSVILGVCIVVAAAMIG